MNVGVSVYPAVELGVGLHLVMTDDGLFVEVVLHGAQRSYFIKCNPRQNAHHQLPIAKLKLLDVLNPKMLISRTILIGHQGVLVV